MRAVHRAVPSSTLVVALAALTVISCASSKKDDGPEGADAGAQKDRGAAKDAYIEEDWLWPDTGEPEPDMTWTPLPDRSVSEDQRPPDEDQGIPDKSTPTPDKSTPTPDQAPADLSLADATPTDSAGPVACGNTGVWIQEVATGQPDFVAIKNAGSAAISVVGYKLEMYGISATTPDVYTIQAADVSGDLSPNAVLYVFENNTGTDPGDINTGENIPFYDGDSASAQKPNAVLLYDAAGALVDYFAVGSVVAKPANVSFTPVAWPATYDSDVSSFQRSAYTGACPSFKTSDWEVAPITRR